MTTHAYCSNRLRHRVFLDLHEIKITLNNNKWKWNLTAGSTDATIISAIKVTTMIATSIITAVITAGIASTSAHCKVRLDFTPSSLDCLNTSPWNTQLFLQSREVPSVSPCDWLKRDKRFMCQSQFGCLVFLDW